MKSKDVEKPKDTPKKKVSIDVCPECKVRENDSSKKKLYKCHYCERYFCKRHLPPRLGVMRNAIEEIKDPVLKNKVYEEWEKTDGHPDWEWTRKYFKELKEKEIEEREKFFKLLDKYKEVKEEKPTQIPRKSSKLISHVKVPTVKVPTTKNLRNFCWRIRISSYSLIKNFIIIFTVLCVLYLFSLNKINFPSILYRSIILLIGGYFLWFIYQKSKRYIPYKWLIISGIIIATFYFYSTGNYSELKIIDKVVGIEGFVDSLKNKFSSLSTSSQNVVESSSLKPSYIKICERKAKEYIENLRLKSTVDFSYNIIEIREFLTPEDAESFAKDKVSSFRSYKICREKMVEFKYVPINLPQKIITIIYEVRYTTPTSICMFDFCGTIEKFTDVIYCGNDGRILEKGISSNC